MGPVGRGGGLNDVGHNKNIVLGGRGAFDRSGSLNMHL
jgi:hypothetical protein